MDIVSCAEAGGWMAGKVGAGARVRRLPPAPAMGKWTTLELLEGAGKDGSSSTDVDGDGRTMCCGGQGEPRLGGVKQGSDAARPTHGLSDKLIDRRTVGHVPRHMTLMAMG